VNRQPSSSPLSNEQNESEDTEMSKAKGWGEEEVNHGPPSRPSVADLRAKVQKMWPGTRLFEGPQEAQDAWSAIHRVGTMGGLALKPEEAAARVEFAITTYVERIEREQPADLMREHLGAVEAEETA